MIKIVVSSPPGSGRVDVDPLTWIRARPPVIPSGLPFNEYVALSIGRRKRD